MPDAPAPDGPYRRRSARVVLLDADGRLLLFRMRGTADRPRAGHCWITPGGGVETDEPLPVAAARELWEETGLRVPPDRMGSPIATTSGYADLGWARGIFRDDFFYHRVDRHDVDVGNLEPVERGQILGHRWWTVQELTTTSEPVYPLGLASVVSDLLAGRVPPEPVRLTWHHRPRRWASIPGLRLTRDWFARRTRRRLVVDVPAQRDHDKDASPDRAPGSGTDQRRTV